MSLYLFSDAVQLVINMADKEGIATVPHTLMPLQDKFKGSYERCAKIIDQYSFTKGLDRVEMFMRLVFSFMVGNSDMHLKKMIDKFISMKESYTGMRQ